jgi:diacylglycerol kinase family enzyme
MNVARPLLIVNPSSGKMGGGRALRRFVAAVERSLGDVDIQATERRGHAIDLARRGALEGRGVVVAVGGDGTLNEVVNGVMQARGAAGGTDEVAPPAAPRVGLIGLGTGGDFGRSLAIGRGLGDYLAVLAGGRTKPIDLIRARLSDERGETIERYVVNVVSAGPGGLVDRYVATYPRLVGGRLAYGLASVRALIECPRAALRLRITAPGDADGAVEREVSTYLLGVCNGAVFGGGMRLAPMARPDDGVLDVISIGPSTKWTVLGNLPKVYRGDHLEVPGVEHVRCRALEVELLDAGAAERFALDVDGEALGRLPLRVEVVPAALTTFVP